MFRKTRKIAEMIARFKKDHPQHDPTTLCWTVIPKGHHYVCTRDELTVGEHYDVVETPFTVVYGPSLIVATKEGIPLGTFPL